jgi:hypothetical protein
MIFQNWDYRKFKGGEAAMKKTVFILMVLMFVFVSFLGSTLCQAQSSKAWAIGSWKGYWHWGDIMWTLIVSGPDGNEAGKLKGSYMWASKKQKSNMFPIPINVQDDTLTFRTVSGDELVLKRISDYRMDGKFKTKEKEHTVRFWKEGETKTSPSQGYYEGIWENELECNLEVLHIDTNAITGIYTCKDLPRENIKGGTGYVNGELTSERTYVVQQLKPEFQFSFLFKKGDEQIDARVLYNARTTNRASFTKKQKPAGIPILEPALKKEPGKVKIENGTIYFAEANTPTVRLEELKTNFPSDSPKEILGIQGKIYGGGDRPRTYLIPLGYDTGTKMLRLLKATANEGTNFKPSKYTIGGVYNSSEGSSMKDVNSKPDAPPVLRFYIMPEKQGYKLHIDWETGGGNDLFPVGEFPL